VRAGTTPTSSAMRSAATAFRSSGVTRAKLRLPLTVQTRGVVAARSLGRYKSLTHNPDRIVSSVIRAGQHRGAVRPSSTKKPPGMAQLQTNGSGASCESNTRGVGLRVSQHMSTVRPRLGYRKVELADNVWRASGTSGAQPTWGETALTARRNLPDSPAPWPTAGFSEQRVKKCWY